MIEFNYIQLGVGVFAGIIIGYIFGKLISKLHFYKQEKSLRKDAIKRSKSVVLGHVNEKIAPILPSFPYNYKDLVFIGKGIDYIVFDGLSAGNLKQVVFLEIKSGKSKQNKNEKMVESTVKWKKVKYEIMKI